MLDLMNKIAQLSKPAPGKTHLVEGTKEVTGGRVHTAEPGGYGRKEDEPESDEDGKKKKKVAPAAGEKRGRGRPAKGSDDTGKVSKPDWSAFGSTGKDVKLAKYDKSKTTKHTLKDWFEKLDDALNEAQLAVQPVPAGQQKPAFIIKDPANPTASAITTSDPAVIDAAKKGTLSMQKPGAAPAMGAKPAMGAGSQIAPMQAEGELDEKWDTATKVSPEEKGKYAGKSKQELVKSYNALKASGPHHKGSPDFGRMRELAFAIRAKSDWGKVQEADQPTDQDDMGAGLGAGRSQGVLEGKKGVNPFAKKDVKKDDKAEKIGKKVTKDIEKDEKKGAAPKKGVNPFAKKSAKGAKPDFLDIDKDGDKKEPMKKAAKEKTKVKEGMDHKLQSAKLRGKSHALAQEAYNCHYDDMEESRMYHEGFKEGLDECYGQMPIRGLVGEMGTGSEVQDMASYGAHTDDMDEDMYDEGNAFTAALAKTPQGSKFKVGGTTFTDKSNYDSKLSEFAFEALDKKLNSLLEGEEKVDEGMTVSISKGQQGAPDSVSVSAQDGEADQLLSIIKSAGLGLFGGEDKGFSGSQGSAGAHGGISVVDDHDGMMSLMKKLSGGEQAQSSDFADEQGQEEQGEEEHSHEDGEETCNECGGMMEEGHACGEAEMVDEVESEDQMTDEVAEANAPDSGADNTNADVAGQVGSDAALAKADAGQDEEEGQVYSSTNEAEDETGEEAGKDLEESTELANGADDTFDADIDFMTKVISGGLNKEKSTGQSTIPVVASQTSRLGSPMKESTNLLHDWKKLSGIK